jgi:chemotaxis protein MotB
MQDGTPIIIKKKKGHGHGHHGGAWKVAYADFVTAMMAFFMVMWIMGMSQETRDVIQGYFRDPIGFNANPPKMKVNIGLAGGPIKSAPEGQGYDNADREQIHVVRKLRDDIEKAVAGDASLKKLLDNQALQVTANEDGLVVEMAENETNSELFFALGSAEVRPRARALLLKIAPVLAQIRRPMLIDGHTDSRPTGRFDYDNFDLSHDRANAVRRILQQGGVPKPSILAVRGFADRDPRRPDDTTHFSNRRVAVLLPFRYQQQTLKGLPADLNRSTIEGVFRLPSPEPPDIRP